MSERFYFEADRDSMPNALAWRQTNNQYIPHFHSTVEVVYVEKGALMVTQDGVATLAQKGSLIVNSCYMLHGYSTPEASETIVAMLPLGIAPALRATLVQNHFAQSVVEGNKVSECYVLMKMMLSSKNQSNFRYLNGLGAAVLALLAERIGMVENETSAESDLLRRILDYLQAHVAEPMSVSQAAAHFGYSVGRFSHIFNQRVGCSFSKYVNSLRCVMARQLLTDSRLSLMEVATACGFASLRTFHRVYKAFTGETPRAAGM